MDADGRARRRHRELPAEKLLAEIVFVAHVDAQYRMAVGLERRQATIEVVVFVAGKAETNKQAIITVAIRRGQMLAGNRHDALALFAGALGDELLCPGGKRGERRRTEKSHFVALG